MKDDQKKRKRKFLIPLGCLSLLVLAITLLPFALEVGLKNYLTERLSDDLQAHVELDALRISWSGKVGLEGLRIDDADGFRHLDARDVRVDVNVRGLLEKRTFGTLDVTGVQLAARQNADGVWSYERLLESAQSGTEGAPGSEPPTTPPPSTKGKSKQPLHFSARWSDISIKLETPNATWTETLKGSLVVDSADDTLELKELTLGGDLAQGVIHGKVSGLATQAFRAEPLLGKLTYIPDRIAPLLTAFVGEDLPVKLAGAEREPLEFELIGPLDRSNLEHHSASSPSTASMGLGNFTLFGYDLSGDVQVSSLQDGAAFLSELDLDGGTLQARGNAKFFGDTPGAEVGLIFMDVPVTGQIAPLLARLHPIFALQDGLEAPDLGGNLRVDLKVNWAASLLAGAPEGGYELRDLAPLDISGRLAFEEVGFEGSPLLDSLQQLLGAKEGARWNLDPLWFHLDGQELSYDQPWTWTIGGVQTIFEGGLNLDGKLNLNWRVPISEKLVGQREELKPLLGASLNVPVIGTLRSPKIEWKEAVTELLGKVTKERAQEALSGELDKVLEKSGVQGVDLEQVLKGDVKPLQGILEDKVGTKSDPEALLKEADVLWDAGKKAEAAKLYNRLRNEFPLSPAYLLNRSRVKSRREG